MVFEFGSASVEASCCLGRLQVLFGEQSWVGHLDGLVVYHKASVFVINNTGVGTLFLHFENAQPVGGSEQRYTGRVVSCGF